MSDTKCSYLSLSNVQCNEPVEKSLEYCKWHASTCSTGEGIKKEIEEKVKQMTSLAGYKLSSADLKHASLIGADLSGADLSRAYLQHAHMYGTNLKGANLFKANLQKANLRAADLRDCNLLGTFLEGTKLENVKWNDNYILINEREADEALRNGDPNTALMKYREAEEIYRSIKLCHRTQGHSKEESPFFYREMVVHRKQMPYFSWHRLWSKLVDLISGYGEKPVNVIRTMLFLIICCAILFGIFGVNYNDALIKFGSSDLPFITGVANLLYFSTVVFTTVGFGDITPLGYSKFIMMIEGFLGQVLMALLIVSFYRKLMSR